MHGFGALQRRFVLNTPIDKQLYIHQLYNAKWRQCQPEFPFRRPLYGNVNITC